MSNIHVETLAEMSIICCHKSISLDGEYTHPKLFRYSQSIWRYVFTWTSSYATALNNLRVLVERGRVLEVHTDDEVDYGPSHPTPSSWDEGTNSLPPPVGAKRSEVLEVVRVKVQQKFRKNESCGKKNEREGDR